MSNAKESKLIEWHPGENEFPVGTLTRLFYMRPRHILNAVLGKGLAWELRFGSRGPRLPIEFFPSLAAVPSSALARFEVSSLVSGHQWRNLPLDRLEVRIENDGAYGLTLFSSGRGYAARVDLESSGKLYEAIIPGDKSTQIPPPDLTKTFFFLDEVQGNPTPEIPRHSTISVDTVAQRLGCTPAHVRSMLRSGRLAGEKIGRDWWIDTQAIGEFTLPRGGYRR